MKRAVVLVVWLSLGELFAARTGRQVSENLPPLPEVETARFLPAIRNQVRAAELSARAHPMDADRVGKYGMLLDAYEQFEAAEACYRRAALLNPSSFSWTYNLATVELQQGEYEQAARDFSRALDLDPRSLVAEIHRGESLLAVGDWDESRKVYEVVLRHDPNSASALYGLGRALAAQGKAAAAVAPLLRACEVFPHYGAAHFALAAVYRKLGESKKAQEQVALYEADKLAAPPLEDSARAEIASLDLSPNSCLRRAAALEQAGDIQGAIRETERALEIDPSDVQAHINLIILSGRLGQIEKSEAQFKQAVALSPDRADAYYNYGVLLVEAHRIPEAEQGFRRAIEINPHYAEAHHNLGTLLDEQGRPDDAAKEYRLALEDRPDYPLAHYHLARILANQGKYDEAIAHLLKALKPEEDRTPSYLFALGATYARAGDRGHALAYLRQAREEATRRGQQQLLSSIEQALAELEH